MDTYGQLFNGGLVKFNMDEYTHARHLLMDGGTSCDCAERGVEARNGKFTAMAFTMGNYDPGSMHDVELNPDDVVRTATDLRLLI